MTAADLTADQDAFRARLSGQLHRAAEELEDAVEQAKQYTKVIPGTVLAGDISTLTLAATAVRTVLRELDKTRKVHRL